VNKEVKIHFYKFGTFSALSPLSEQKAKKIGQLATLGEKRREVEGLKGQYVPWPF
jgi:hypothetical protein